jgi:hypothetical protein
MKNEDFLNLAYPPQWVGKIFHFCISGAMLQNNDRGLKTELIYCVIPLIADEDVRKNLNRAISSSTFFSIFETKMKDRQEFLINFSKKSDSFHDVTKKGLIYLGNIEKLNFGEYLSISPPIKPKKDKKVKDFEFERASYYLGQLFAKEDPKNIYLKLGMVPK